MGKKMYICEEEEKQAALQISNHGPVEVATWVVSGGAERLVEQQWRSGIREGAGDGRKRGGEQGKGRRQEPEMEGIAGNGNAARENRRRYKKESGRNMERG